jgi:hypothetical protein
MSKQIIDLNGFYKLSPPESSRNLADWAEDMDHLETIECPIDSGHRRPGRRMPNLSVTLPGNTVRDFVWTWGSSCLFTDRVLSMFTARGFAGFTTKPVKAVFRRCKDSPPKLWELVVTGWAGMAPPESGIKLRMNCPGCGQIYYSSWTDFSKLIDRSQWDGADFFMVWPLPKFIFITGRVAAFIREQKFTGALILPTANFRDAALSTLSPGRLSYSMPEDRARELGEPLGIY